MGILFLGAANALTKLSFPAVIDMKIIAVQGIMCISFPVDKVMDAIGGQSLVANLQLVWNNCAIAAKLAVDYATLT